MRAELPTRASLFRGIGQIDQEYAQVWSRPGLRRKDRRWVTLACLAARSAVGPLRGHIRGALASGDITVEEMMEGVLHFASSGGMACAEPFDDLLWEVVDELGLPIPATVAEHAPEWLDEDERMAVQSPEIRARGVITGRERRLISLVCAALGGASGPAAEHWNGALACGDLTSDELGEVALHFAFCAGWPQHHAMPRQVAHDTSPDRTPGAEA